MRTKGIGCFELAHTPITFTVLEEPTDKGKVLKGGNIVL